MPFDDPVPEVDRIVADMKARINGEEALINLAATEYEKKDTHLKRILKKNLYDLETSLSS